jgi:hypothetical protein
MLTRSYVHSRACMGGFCVFLSGVFLSCRVHTRNHAWCVNGLPYMVGECGKVDVLLGMQADIVGERFDQP